jgi:hypothetical protein
MMKMVSIFLIKTESTAVIWQAILEPEKKAKK